MITQEITDYLNGIGAESTPKFAAFAGQSTPGQRRGNEEVAWVSVILGDVTPGNRTDDGTERQYSASATLNIIGFELGGFGIHRTHHCFSCCENRRALPGTG